MHQGMRIAASAAVAIGVMLALPLGAGKAEARETVRFTDSYRPGTIVIKTRERRLYLVMRDGKAMRYRVGVGRRGKQWSGRTRITRKVVDPTFTPPAQVKRDIPTLPDLIPPGPRNPLGPRAMTLSRGEYAIHGTNRPGSVGGYVSYGCIRMYNKDVVDLFERVRVGTPVVVLP